MRHHANSRQDPTAIRSTSLLARGPYPTAKVGRRQPNLTTVTRFAIVGASGILVNQLLLWLWVSRAGLHYLLGAIVATQGSTAWNFCLAERWVFPNGKARRLRARLLLFLGVNNFLLLLRVPLLALLTSSLGVHYLISNLITLLCLFLARLLISDHFIWKTDQAAAPAASARARPTGSINPPSLHLYDVGGLVSIASEIALHELQDFRVPSLASNPDLRIRVSAVGAPGLRTRPVVTHGPSFVAYDEHLGRRAANFRLDFEPDRIDVVVAPLLGRSPHVVYTNVVEALLRFVLVSRGRVLLHSATVELGGRGVMVTGRTDTGKTSTILRLVRDHQAAFLSDDMTIVEPQGVAHCYPKPLTISAHTMRAVNGHALTTDERLRLAVRSRVHSRSGRRLGGRLAALNLPIMALNAVTQELIPPPKYRIDQLLPCGHCRSTEVRELFVIERGPLGLEELNHQQALDVLIENTDDAYSFPPFRYFAPTISIDGENYTTLRQRERALLSSFLSDVRVWRLVRDDFSWADAIPLLLNGQDDSGPGLGKAARRPFSSHPE